MRFPPWLWPVEISAMKKIHSIASHQAAPEVTAPEVRAHLAAILDSEAFQRARRMQRFLEFIVEETLAGREDQLGEFAIGLAVFDRGADFEPALDPIVRNDARRLRAKLAEYHAGPKGREAEMVIDIPKGGYVPVFRRRTTPATEIAAPRLAVLPFEDLSGNPEGAVPGRALAMLLTARLTDIAGIETVAQSFLAGLWPDQATWELGISHVVNGFVWRASDRWRVVVNLIQVTEGAQLWAAEFDCETVLTACPDIAAVVAREVKVRLAAHSVKANVVAMAA
jgi:TolB-like protein